MPGCADGVLCTGLLEVDDGARIALTALVPVPHPGSDLRSIVTHEGITDRARFTSRCVGVHGVSFGRTRAPRTNAGCPARRSVPGPRRSRAGGEGGQVEGGLRGQAVEALEADRAFEAPVDQAVLVRPDGHIAWQAPNPPADDTHLLTVLRGILSAPRTPAA